MSLRLLSLPLMAAALFGLMITTASAQWCARMQGGESCGFSTLAQCRATVSGVGGSCFPNPRGGPAYRAEPGFDTARRARIEQMKNWRKAIQERQAERRKELARERQQRRAAPSQAAAPAPAVSAAGPRVAVADLDTNAVPSLGRDGIRRVQQVLKDKGFDPGPLNGVPGPRLKNAVRSFQSRYGIAARGDIDNQTLLALGEAELASQSNR